MSHHLNFTCPNCGHQYSTTLSTGPRAACPKCGHDPAAWELLDRRSEGAIFFAFWLLILITVSTIVFRMVQ